MAEKYTALIGRVIDDFDSIFAAIAAKGVTYENDHNIKLGTGIATVDGGKVPTARYASYITSQLVKIENLSGTSNTVISNYNTSEETVAGRNTTLGTGTAGETTTVFPVNIIGLAPGYYGEASTVTGTITAEDYTFNATNLQAVDGNYYYVPAGKLISSVTVAKGKVNVAITDDSITNSLVVTPGVTFDKTGDVDILTSDEVGTNASGYYAINYKLNATKSGSLKVAPDKSDFTAGYVKAADVTVTGNQEGKEEYIYTFSGTEEQEDTQTLYIPMGSLTVTESNTNGATASITGTGINWAADNEDGIVISAAVGKISLSGTITEGYVIPDETGSAISLPEISVNSGSKKIKKATLSNITIADTADKEIIGVSGTASTLLKDTASTGAYELDLAVSESVTKTVSPTDAGYLEGGVTYTGTVTGSSKYYIDKASLTLNPTATATASSTITSDTKVNDDDIAITIKPDISFNKALVSAGYLKDGTEVTNGTVTKTEKTVWVKKGKVTTTNGLTVTHTERDDDGDGTHKAEGSLTATEIFTSSAPTSGDYYTITATAGTSLTKEGYVSSVNDIDLAAASAVKYLPKAIVEWVDNGDGKEDYLHVKVGGYLPSGNITNITTAALEAATVALVNSNTETASVFTPFGKNDLIPEGALTLTLGKGTVDAGYFSSSSGEIATSFYINKATLNVSSSESEALTPDSDVVWDATAEKYSIGVSGTILTQITLPESGYITAADLKLNGETYSSTANTQTLSTSVVLDKATVGVDATKTSLTLGVATSLKTTTDSSKGYAVTPNLVSGSVEVATTREGYLSTDDASTLTLASTNAGTQTATYIERGAGATLGLVSTDGLNVASNLGQTVSGDYTVTVSGTVSVNGTIAEGYYGEDVASISSKTLTLTEAQQRTLTITHGSVTSKMSASTKVTTAEDGTGVVFASTVDNTNKEYVSFTAEIDTLSNELTTTAGYVKAGDVTKATTNEIVNSSVTKHIQAFTTTLKDSTSKISVIDGTVEGTKLYEVTIGQTTDSVELANAKNAAYQELELDTDGKYSKYDTKIVLGAHAMGTAVVDELTDLEQRLAGAFTRTIA